jgi:hypothetical protein
MKVSTILALGVVIFVSTSCVCLAAAEDLFLEGSLASGTYQSDAGITIRNNCVINSGVSVITAAAFETVLRPGTHIRTGARFVARIRDDDGLSNHCEMLYFGHLNYGPQDDPDIDWLDNYAECTLATNPALYDMDNDDDGLADWWEIKYFGYTLETNPNEDSDGDGVLNYIEFKLRTNPVQKDLAGPGVHYEYDGAGRKIRIYRIPAK